MFSRIDAPIRSVLRAYLYGFRDGWREPHELTASRNIEHLAGYGWWLQNEQDRAINWGQRVRSPFRHQRLDSE